MESCNGVIHHKKEELLGHIGGGQETCCKRIVQRLGTSDVQGDGDIIVEFCLSLLPDSSSMDGVLSTM
eukprot:13786371-Ditylum_brightwellii.AAC.1